MKILLFMLKVGTSSLSQHLPSPHIWINSTAFDLITSMLLGHAFVGVNKT